VAVQLWSGEAVMAYLKLRVTEDEDARLREAASRSGLKISHFLRRAIERELANGGYGKDMDRARTARVQDLELYAYLTRPDVKDRHRRDFARAHPGARNAHLRPEEPIRPKGLRFQLALSSDEVLAVEAHGEALELRPAQFCTVLVRRWLGLRRAPPASTANALGLIRNELRRIGVNINQIARAANAMADPQPRGLRRMESVDVDDVGRGIVSLPALIREIVGLVADIDVHMGRERRYWDIRTVDSQEVDPHPSAPESDDREAI
jgi:hypothetical protein